jgi:PAS domain S-box-containing protein
MEVFSKTADAAKMDCFHFLRNFTVPAALLDLDLLIVDANEHFSSITRFDKLQHHQKSLMELVRFNETSLDLRKQIDLLASAKTHSLTFKAKWHGAVASKKNSQVSVLLMNVCNEELILGLFTEIAMPAGKLRPEVTDEHLFRLLLDELPDAIYFKDLKGRFFLTNRLHAKKLGLENADAFTGKSDFDLFSKVHAHQAYTDEQYVIRTGNTISKEEKETHIQGAETWASTSKMPLRNESGEMVGTFGISKDITKIKNAEIKLRKAEKILQEANDAKDKFFSILAHDLKNPFNSLLGLSDLLVDDFDDLTDAEKLDMLIKIRDTSESAYALLENLLDWAHVQSGSISINKKVCHLKPIIEDVLEVNKLHAYNKHIKLASDVPDDLKLITDENMLRTIMRNLISNAIKFTMPGGQVWVKAVEEDDTIKIVVEDNGIGMDKSILDKLFRISEKVKTYGTADESGTGLGLVIVKEFVKKNNGRIAVESREGSGSRFTITLPAQK